jgi:hypothetical protein
MFTEKMSCGSIVLAKRKLECGDAALICAVSLLEHEGSEAGAALHMGQFFSIGE